jgi:Bacteriophage HK97-gp10, putative tail-component
MAGIVTIEGFPELDATLKSLIEERGEQILRKALRAGGELMQAAVIERAPMRTDGLGGGKQNAQNPAYDLPAGALKSDIKLTVRRDRDDNSLTATIRPGKYSAPVAYWLEYGHQIVRGGRYRGAKGKGQVIGHVPAHPFIRVAHDETEGAALAAVEETIATEINKLARR